MGTNYNCYALSPEGKPIFDESGKPDLKNGDIYISVSQILSQESAGDFLTTWLLNTFGSAPDPLKAYKSYMEKVSDLGTRLHHFIECDLKNSDYPFDIKEDMEPGIESWISFRRNHDIETVDSERILFSKKLRVAGTMDMALRVDGKLYIGDLKTGTVYNKAFVQLSAYSHMYHEMGLLKEPADLLVLGGADSKTKIADGGAVIMHTLDSKFGGRVDQKDLFAHFMCLRYVWFMNNVKTRKFEPVIKGMQEALDPMVERFKAQYQL